MAPLAIRGSWNSCNFCLHGIFLYKHAINSRCWKLVSRNGALETVIYTESLLPFPAHC